MTTHRRALLLRASAVVALAAASIVGVGSPAFADVGLSVGPKNLDLKQGESRDFGVTIRPDAAAASYTLTVQLPGALSGDLTLTGKDAPCTGSGSSVNCTVTFAGTGTPAPKTFQFTVAAKASISVPAGSTKDGNGSVSVEQLGGGDEANDSFNIKLSGPAQVASVPEVSGTVTDSTTGQPVKNAAVGIQDSTGKRFNVEASNTGTFKITSQADNPIAPGTITMAAAKEGFETITATATARAGQGLTGQKLKLKPKAGASISPAPTVTEGPAATEPAGAGEQSAAASDQPSTKAASGTSVFSWVLIVLGGLLVLLGIGAIVLLLRRGKDDDDDGDGPGGPADPHGPADDHGPIGRDAVPAAAGARGGYGSEPDPTMISRNQLDAATAMAPRSNSMDATAIVHPQQPAEDPYGMPTQPRSGYPGGATGYVSPQAPAGYGAAQVGNPNAYGATQVGNPNAYGPTNGYDGDGYGAAGGYGPSSRPAADGYSAADYADGGYGQPAGGGYGPAAGGYGPAAGGGGYGAANGYGPDEVPQGYDAGRYPPAGGNGGGYPPGAPHNDAGGYPPAAPHHAGYADPGYGGGGAQPGGYDQRGGYEPSSGAYDRDPYERAPEPRAGSGDYGANGYGPNGGGYPPAGYDDGQYGAGGGQQPPRQAPSARGTDRRSLDWLDD